jgi:protein-disulfide isomerase
MKRLVAAAIVIALAGGPSLVRAQAQPPEPSHATLASQNEAILTELKAIRQLLEKLTAAQSSAQQGSSSSPQVVRVRNSNQLVLGSADAPLTMIEFTDLECPFCRQYAATGFEEIRKAWIDTGRLRYLARDLPLDSHVHSLMSARAARCAGDQQRFWEMRTTLMRNGNLLSPEFIAKTAEGLKLDMKAFNACAASTTHDAEIQADVTEAVKLNLRGTPTFVIGRTTPDEIEGIMLVGAQPFAAFDATLKALLPAGSR